MRTNWSGATQRILGRPALVGAVRDLRAGTVNVAARAWQRPTATGATHRRRDALHLPVLLVHGYGGDKSDWFRLSEALAAAGFGHVTTFEYDSLTLSIPAAARRLDRAVRRIVADTGAPAVHVIGHSLGGLVVRYAVTGAGTGPLIRAAVTVATPHGGCRLALLGIGPAVAQLRPGSAVLRHLETSASAGSTRWAAFWSDADLVVSPNRARIRPPALAARNTCIPGEGHLSILQSPRLAREVLAHLRGAEVDQAPLAA
jgi:pimeloyl-ACP methyl ester carboxylesterase